MEQNYNYCRFCAKGMGEKETVFHPVRMGYSPSHFPLFHYEKVPLCPSCLLKKRKIDLVEKGFALAALALVLYLLAAGVLNLFMPYLKGQ